MGGETQRAGLAPDTPSSGPCGVLDGCSLQQLPPRNRRHGLGRSPLSTPDLGEGRALRASPAQPGTPGPAPSDRPTCLPPRPRDTQQPRPRPAGQRRDKRRPQLPVHGLGVPLYPATPLPRRPQPGQVRGPLPAAGANPLTSALGACGRLAPSPGALSACCPSQPVLYALPSGEQTGAGGCWEWASSRCSEGEQNSQGFPGGCAPVSASPTPWPPVGRGDLWGGQFPPRRAAQPGS